MRGSRVIGPAALAATGALCLFLGRTALLVWMLLVAFSTAGELYRLARARGVRPTPLIGFAGILGLLLVAHARGERSPQLFPAVVAIALGLTFGEHVLRKRQDATRAIGATMAPVLSIGLLGAYVLAVRSARQGFRLALALALVWAGAELAIAVHARYRAAGISAASVAEQAAAAVAGALLLSVVVALTLNPPFTWLRSLAVAAVGGAATAAGHRVGAMLLDESAERGARQSLRLVPLVDGLFLAAPLFFYVFRVVGR